MGPLGSLPLCDNAFLHKQIGVVLSGHSTASSLFKFSFGHEKLLSKDMGKERITDIG